MRETCLGGSVGRRVVGRAAQCPTVLVGEALGTLPLLLFRSLGPSSVARSILPSSIFASALTSLSVIMIGNHDR